MKKAHFLPRKVNRKSDISSVWRGLPQDTISPAVAGGKLLSLLL